MGEEYRKEFERLRAQLQASKVAEKDARRARLDEREAWIAQLRPSSPQPLQDQTVASMLNSIRQ